MSGAGSPSRPGSGARTALAFAFAAVLLFGRLGGLPLLNPDEGRNAEVAREMAASGRWLIPTYNGLPYMDKPAFYFKAVGLSFAAFGTSEGAARLPSALFGLALLVLIYGFARREYGRRTADLSVAVVAAMPLFLALARIVIFDMTLAFFVSGAILAAYRAEEEEGTARGRWYLLGAACAGFATLVKGPVGFIVPTLVVLAFGFVDGRKGVAKRLFHPWNLLVFLALVLPWFIGASLQRPDFPYYGLVRESLSRFTTEEFHRTAPFYYYGPVLLGVCFAWSLLFPEAAVVAWRRRSSWSRADRLLVTWALVVVAFFSISQSKLPGYVLTAVVALGVLTARLFALALADPRGRAARVVRHGAVVLAVMSVVLGGWLAMEVFAPGVLTGLFHIDSNDYERARAVFPPVLATMGAMAIAAIVGLRSRRPSWIFASFLVLPLSLVTVSFGGLREYARDTSSSDLATAVASALPSDDTPVATLQAYPGGLAFYLRRPLVLITEDGHETTSNYIPFYLSQQERWPPEMVPLVRRDAWLDARAGPVLVLSRKERRPALDSLAAGRGGTVREMPHGWWGVLLPGAGGL